MKIHVNIRLLSCPRDIQEELAWVTVRRLAVRGQRGKMRLKGVV